MNALKHLFSFFIIDELYEDNTSLSKCYCLILQNAYYTEKGPGYTLDQHRALRMTLEEAMALQQSNNYYKNFEVKAVPSLALL